MTDEEALAVLGRQLAERTEQLRQSNLALRRETAERRQLEQRLRTIGDLDPLTGLANGRVFEDRLATALLRTSAGQGDRVSLLAIDLDGFRAVNEQHGSGYGDWLLLQVGRRIRHCIGAADTVARLGGDEFAVLLEGTGDDRQVAGVAERVMASLVRPFSNEHRVMSQVGVSVGIARHPEAGGNATELMRAASQALLEAKRQGRGLYRFFRAPGA